ncbi:hypothetical protein LTR36_005094 [Oleoguttula mirabilis]|uniref:Uncharacterized protein n=1 Tax=Oleoguttula mirabilis TaxID=1507867 RepID=A0AAV9JXD5_9PEZI|nr:hypothetical protein LTR36_005094 [Oleoguttula mirabilis]
MRSALAAAAQRRVGRSRSTSLSTVPPQETSAEFVPELAAIAASILYRSPLPSREGRPVYILNAAAFPDAFETDYDSLLSYVLARLPGEDELLSGTEYEIIFFAGGQPEGATTEKKQGPGMGWYLQAYHVLSRATRKKLQRLYIVHPRTWVRVLVGVFGTVVSPKFRRKIVHVNILSQLAVQQPIYRLLIPPAVYLHDRKLTPEIEVPYASGKRAFGARHPFPKNISTCVTRLPRVLREATSFLLLPTNVGTEGLFRIPPHSTLAGILKEAYDRGQQYIVWKERDATVVQPGLDPILVDEVRLEDAYGVHLAASLIKAWYRELREPIFPESCYEQLRQRYSSPDVVVTPEDLVDLILPASSTSPISATSREVLTRHLFPLLSEIAAHEAQNKMGAENLSICFSMCLVCGSNQLEDAKMSSIIRRILQAAIEMWPQLRVGLGIDGRALETDLRPPADPREYEDPMEDESDQRMSEDDAVETKAEHRIILDDAEEKAEVKKAPTLPPRPPPLSRSRAASAAKHLPGLDVISPVRRKPAPASAGHSPLVAEPPRYSRIFDSDGHSVHVADSPVSYVPFDGLGPQRRGNATYPEDKKMGFPVVTEPTDPHPALNMPKRKALSSELKREQLTITATHATTTRSASDGPSLARMAAQKAVTAALVQRMPQPSTIGNPDEVVQSPETAGSENDDDAVFRKPSWPASASAARQHSHPQTSSAKPALPTRHSQTVPIISTTPPAGNANTNGNNGNGLSAPSFPRRRTPSPGLLARMSTMEPANEHVGVGSWALGPKKLNLRKASVDDLRRLYEERVSTAESLRKADVARRDSSPALSF